METGELIIYTSADPVLQIAPTKTSFLWMNSLPYSVNTPVPSLWNVQFLGRIIARPMLGNLEFHTYSQPSTWLFHHLRQLVLDKLNEAGIDTYAAGKINDIFNGAGEAGARKRREDRGSTFVTVWL